MNISELEIMKTLYGNHKKNDKVVTKSYRKGRRYRVQQIFDRHGFVVKQIIHQM